MSSMSELCVGQPIGGIIQMAYVVQDIGAAMAQWTADLRVGPWFLLDHFTGVDPVYRGQPSRAGVALAMGYAADIARHLAHGYELAFEAGVPTGGKVAYLDTNGALPGYLEVIEFGAVMEEVFTRFWRASVDWDGSDPVRPFG
jgi:hypothetical protein